MAHLLSLPWERAAAVVMLGSSWIRQAYPTAPTTRAPPSTHASRSWIRAHLDVESADAAATLELVRAEGRKAISVAGDIREEPHCEEIIRRAVSELGGVDILVNNAAYQMAHDSLEDITAQEFDRTFRTEVYATFFLSKAAARTMPPGRAIINTVSINSDKPKLHNLKGD